MRASSFVHLSRPASVLMLLLSVATLTYAQITPSDDAYVNSAAPTVNYGAAVTLNLSSAADSAFIRFDLTPVPASYTGASIAKATLKLYVNTVPTAGSFNVDYVTGTWAEKTIKYSTEPAIGTTIAASVPLITASKGTYVEIDITPAMVAWLNNTQPNDGIALVANSPLVATFDSKENTAASHPPEIDIVFAGGGGGITGITTASGSGLTGGGTSGTLNLSLTNTCAANQVLQWNGTAWVCANLKGGGTVTRVGLTAPSTDFIVTGSPVTTSGTLGLGWLVAPDPNNTANAIVKRDSSGNFSAGTINAVNGFNLGGIPFAFGVWDDENAFLGFAGNTTTTGYMNTASGVYALLKNTTGHDNTASGWQALTGNTTGLYNTASGSDALQVNATGNDNTASGYQALWKNATGNDNTASGYQALLANTASENAAFGSGALYSNTTGQQNTASGYQALYSDNTGSFNTAAGSQALYGNSSGGANTAYGWKALGQNTVGYYNAAGGLQALWSNTTGNYNTALGYTADVGSGNLNNATAIGAQAYVTQSNSLVLGMIKGVNGGFANTNVGIGTTTPTTTLQVAGGDMSTTAAGSGLIVKSPDSTKCARIGINNSGAIVATSITCP
jgi:hypothetical protein